MPTIDQIKEKIKMIDGASKLLARREIKELPRILWEDEDLEKMVQGFYSNGQGVLVATNKRLIFVNKGLFGGLKLEDFPYDKISSIQYDTGILMGTLTIFTSGNKAEISQVPKAMVRAFGDYVRARISAPKVHASMPAGDFISQLERLAKLKEQGVLSESEFIEQKKKIMGA